MWQILDLRFYKDKETTMNLSYNKGAISKLMVINILLILLITATVFVLLVPRDEDNLQQTISTSPATPKPSQSISPTPADSQAEIDVLKKQLKSETSKLQSLRVNQQQLEAERSAPKIVQDTVDQSASGVPETKTPPKNQGE